MHKLTSDRVSPTISSDLFLFRSFGTFVFSSEYLHQLFAHVVRLLGGTIMTFKILHCIQNRGGKFLFWSIFTCGTYLLRTIFLNTRVNTYFKIFNANLEFVSGNDRVLTKAQEESVHGHIVDAEERRCYYVRSNNNSLKHQRTQLRNITINW